MMLKEAKGVGFIPVSDLAEAEQFFCGKLGLEVHRPANGFALVLRTGSGSTLRCVLAPPGTRPQPFTIFGWLVEDIGTSVKALMAAGIKPIVYPHFQQDEDGVWAAPTGDRVTWFHDPDGNVLSLSQPASA